MSDNFTLPLPLYEKHGLGTLQSKNGDDFIVSIGLDRDLVSQLKERSRDMSDVDLQKNTSDLKRFGGDSYEDWYAKERTPYALTDKNGTLAALAWFGPKPLGRKSLRFLSEEELAKESQQEKNEWHTIVYRSYAPFRGIGIMTPFVRFSMDDYKKRYPGAKLWAGISTDNPSSMALAAKLGFKQDPKYVDADAHWCAMVEV
jgi:RimJ/RimL family protein N-acetyltransferase